MSQRQVVFLFAVSVLSSCGSSLANPRQLPIYVSRSSQKFDGIWLELRVHRDGRHWYGDRVIFDPSKEERAVLRRALIELRRAALTKGDITEIHDADRPAEPHIDAPILIRSHRRAEWVHVQYLQKLCASSDLALQAVRLAVLED